ncbi:MAG: energy-coupling factor transporter transmembrane protein EcfT [Roseiflexus sp.]|nr:energy-coupling factor transporter transmembrane protein EcfT [Roseiflexus sp.]MCS7287900.1 energy-coupling factor transporter transmembrane protein EcfT [Roseiflexus sp.]MDW8144858.1 energy-coupling factor transporter transmembrane component T [Roseiflexaceae bacterium]MDW8233029.1 energy-coupling factor transporter transmembrane component T [Roseiflexaceae bacterium]
MQRTGLFIERAGFLQRLNPLTKITGALLLIGATFLLPAPLTGAALLGGVLLPLALASLVVRRFLDTLLKTLLPVLISLALVQGLFFPTADPATVAVGPLLFRRAGIQFALDIGSRLLVVAGAPLLVFQTTHPGTLVQALIQRGMPRSVGYMLLTALQLIPAVTERAARVAEAQRARGLETEGNILQRIRGLLPLISPLIVGALIEAEERAMALEARAFNAPGPKTWVRDIPDPPAERMARIVMLTALGALIVWRVATLALG